MKKFSVFLIAFLFLIAMPISSVSAETSKKEYYARVESPSVQFFENADTNSALFTIPETFFVRVDGVQDNFYAVTYKEKQGFVLKDQVRLVDGTPMSPYVNLTYTQVMHLPMFSQPNTSSEIVDNLESRTQITYYGEMIGVGAQAESDVWYFSSVLVNSELKFGYVYSETTYDKLSNSFRQNSEGPFATLDESMLFKETESFASLSTGTKILLIVAIAVPSLLILYFLIRPGKIAQASKNRKKAKTENKKVQHGDYFEFDESKL